MGIWKGHVERMMSLDREHEVAAEVTCQFAPGGRKKVDDCEKNRKK